MAGLTILTPTNYANAESTEEYFKITSATTFVADTSGDEFVIPETYYVLKNETQDNGNFYYVTYMEITGKILKTLVDTAVEDVYEPYFPRIIYTNSADTIVFDFSQTTIATLPENTNLDFVGSYNMLSFGNHVPTFYVRYLDGETTKYGYILPTSTNNPDLAEKDRKSVV